MCISKSDLTEPRERLLVWIIRKMKDMKGIFSKNLSCNFLPVKKKKKNLLHFSSSDCEGQIYFTL